VALEGHQKDVKNRYSSEGDYHRPDNKDVGFADAYLHEKNPNVSL
jgi:hypothetical protein